MNELDFQDWVQAIQDSIGEALATSNEMVLIFLRGLLAQVCRQSDRLKQTSRLLQNSAASRLIKFVPTAVNRNLSGFP